MPFSVYLARLQSEHPRRQVNAVGILEITLLYREYLGFPHFLQDT